MSSLGLGGKPEAVNPVSLLSGAGLNHHPIADELLLPARQPVTANPIAERIAGFLNPQALSTGLSVGEGVIEKNREQILRYLKSPTTSDAKSLNIPPLTGQSPGLLPYFMALKGEILSDLEKNISGLLTLNVSRREAVAQYLDRLAGQGPGPSTASGNMDAAAGLRRWIDGPKSPSQVAALSFYFEEVALFTLGISLLLKSWSDRGVRKWQPGDISHLNWALNTALKPHTPLDRENWLIARQNIYSWYKPSPTIQKEIWETLSGWSIGDEGPQLLLSLLAAGRQAQVNHPDPQGYDSRFYQSLWRQMPHFGLDPASSPGPIRRSRVIFSPTLRNGGMVRAAPAGMTWIGLESSPFHLMMAELMQLWWGMSPPPLWSSGSGLEVHTRDQLSLNLGSPKPSLLSRITEMEACDAAFVLEERIVRLQGRSPQAQHFREQIECLPYFKKLKAPGTSLGVLQACIALSKLRPGGLLWWSREEALLEQDGREALNFLLERGKLICEWDFSQLEHSLPSNLTAFPKHLYLFAREPQVEARLTHRPLRISLRGQIRSHVEVPLVLEDALRAHLNSEKVRDLREARSPWSIHVQISPTAQRDWAERWPDPASHSAIRQLERLREMSIPLASATTIRHTPDPDPNKDHRWGVHPGLKGFWIHAEHNAEAGRQMIAAPLPLLGSSEIKGAGFLVLVPDEKWVTPLSRYLESEPVRLWMDHHAERKGDRWVLNEQVVRCIPVPESLLRTLGHAGLSAHVNHETDPLVLQIISSPKNFKDSLKRQPEELHQAIESAVFVRASLELQNLNQKQQRFNTLIAPNAKIRWGELLKLVPAAECIALSMHPLVQISGNLPLHMAISRIERVKTPLPGIFFATEAGFHLCLASDSQRIIEMIWDQVDGLTAPTWSELVSYVRLPRRLDLAEATANDVLRIHGENARRIDELGQLVSACSLL